MVFTVVVIGCTALVTTGLCSIKHLLNQNTEIKQSHTMMSIHLLIFNAFAVFAAINQVFYFGYSYGYFNISYFADTMSIDIFEILLSISFCVL